MAGLDVSRLAPADCAAALRSYPRRFRVAITAVDDDERPDDVAHRAGPDGRSAVDVTEQSARAIAMLADAASAIGVSDSPTLPAAVLDESARDHATDRGRSVESALDLLTLECDSLADAVDRVDAESWNRAGRVDGTGRTVSALDVVREAVRTGAESLRAAEAAMAHARHAR